jgi:hypothetical protein
MEIKDNRTHITQSNLQMPGSVRSDVYEIIAAYSEVRTKPINTLWRSHIESRNAEAGVRCYLSALE